MNEAPVARAAFTGCLLAILLPVSAWADTRAGKATHNRKKAKLLVHQEASNLPIYGPNLPAEPYLYPQPQPLCQEMDVVLEVLVHEEGPASSEGQVEQGEPPGTEAADAPKASLSASTEALAGIARKVGSFFRPKTSSARIRPEDVDLSDLLSARLLIPVEGAGIEKMRDTFLASRGRYRKHLAIDIGAPRGTPVVATSDGEIVKTPREKRGGRTIYMKDLTGQYLFYYAHLSKYAPGIAAGRKVHRGDVIGYVGSTGHVVGGPHLHFSIARVPDEEDTQREGLAINPYLLFLASVP
ncbi:MAG: M23 family metallopeptidase [Thermoanaerobaculia bacterium]